MFPYAQGPFPIFACLAWVLVPGWTLMIIGRMIMNELDATVGTIALCVTVILGAFMFHPPTPLAGALAVWAVWLTMLGWIPATQLIERRYIRDSKAEEIETVYGTLAMNPNHLVAKFRLARLMAESGFLHHADALAQAVLPGMPKDSFREEYRLAQGWAMAAAARTPTVVRCGGCGGFIPPGAAHCPACGAAWLLSGVSRRGGGGPVRTVAVWGALVILLLGIGSLSALPLMGALIAGVVIVGLAGGLLYWAFHPTAEGAA